MSFARFILVWLIGLAPSILCAQSADFPGSADHPMMSRYVGSVITGMQKEEYGESEIPLSPAFLKDGQRGFETLKRVEGKRTRLLYQAPALRTSLEVMRNYREAMVKANAKTLWECAGVQCGSQFYMAFYADTINSRKLRGRQITEYAYAMNTEDERYVAAQVSKPDGSEVFMMVFSAMQENSADMASGKRVITFVEILETKAMDRGMVSIDASAMSKGLAAEGKIAIYGLYFDTDKADIKPESKPQLDEMAKLLTTMPSLKVYIVGHTDNQGALEYNRNLSQKRAESVVKALTSQYGIAASRLAAHGVANLAPVASNEGEAGRSKNRRVELVAQ
jgi:OOP family OmpA-OmpF porin